MVKEAEGVSNRMTMTIPLFVRFDIVKQVYGDLLYKKAIGKELNSLNMMENSLNDYQLLTFSWDGYRQSHTTERQREINFSTSSVGYKNRIASRKSKLVNTGGMEQETGKHKT